MLEIYELKALRIHYFTSKNEKVAQTLITKYMGVLYSTMKRITI